MRRNADDTKADGTVDKESAVGKYELGKTKDSSLIVKSNKEDVRFRVGTSTLLLRSKRSKLQNRRSRNQIP